LQVVFNTFLYRIAKK